MCFFQTALGHDIVDCTGLPSLCVNMAVLVVQHFCVMAWLYFHFSDTLVCVWEYGCTFSSLFPLFACGDMAVLYSSVLPLFVCEDMAVHPVLCYPWLWVV